MIKQHFKGMVAATFTPIKMDGTLDINKVPDMVEKLINNGIKGIFVCGSTGEGPSLTGNERKLLAEAFVHAVNKRIAVFIHVGHNSIAEARGLAAHAQKVGADYISATPPSYFKIGTISSLIDCLAEIASGAPELPFYYYNIPALTGVALDMTGLLKNASEALPTLAGIKYTTPLIHEYQACLNYNKGEYDLLYGTDEMLLSALVVGAKGFIGSTYNFAAPLYRRIAAAFDSGDLPAAKRLQLKAVEMVRIIVKYGGLPAQKVIMQLVDMDCGRVRLPLRALQAEEIKSMKHDLKEIGFFEWASDGNGIAKSRIGDY